MAGIDHKLLHIFGGKQVVVRTSCLALTETGLEGLMLYFGYLLDMDDEYIYLSSEPHHDTIHIALSRETVDEVTIYEEQVEAPDKKKIISLVKEVESVLTKPTEETP